MQFEREDVELIDINWLKAHEEVHPKKVIELFEMTLRWGGYTKPLLIDRETGTILDGHHRYEVGKKLELNYIPAIVIDYLNDDRVGVTTWPNSGLEKIETFDFNNNKQEVWRPKIVLEYIQWNDVKPDFIFDISGYLKIKLDAVKAYSSQLFNPNSSEKETPISSKNFIESVSYRAKNMGRLINSEAGEGFNSRQILSISDLNSFLK